MYHSPTDAAPQFLQKLIPFVLKINVKSQLVLQQGASNSNLPDQFLADVLEVSWSIFDVFGDPEHKLKAFNLLFNSKLDKYAPFKTVKIRRRPKPFVTREIRDLMKSKDQW